MIKKKEKELNPFQVELNIKDILRTTKEKEKELIFLKKGINMKENGKMD